MTHTVEIVATGLNGPQAVELLHAHADRIDALRQRAVLVLADIDLDHPARDIVAVDKLRRTVEADGLGWADLGEAVEWADRQPLSVCGYEDFQAGNDMANAQRVAEGK